MASEITIMAKREQKSKNKGASGMHRKSGEEFLKTNSLKEEVTETSSGLQYQVVQASNEQQPTEWSSITIHQRALLLNGTPLEDTYKKSTPVEVAINELIEGLQEGIQLMGVGARYKFWVPSELAWGKKGTSNKIPPNAVLQFDIKLISINK